MANGWWNLDGAIETCVAAYEPVGAADIAASYVNKFNPGTNNAAPQGTPVWDATDGWKGNGNWYLNTGINPTNGQTTIVRYSGFSYADLRVIFGNVVAPAYFIAFVGATSIRFYAGASNTDKTISYGSSGVLAMSDRFYYNGVDLGALTTGDNNDQIAILGTPTNQFKITANIQAFATYSAVLTPTQIASITTLMNALPVAPTDALTALDMTLSAVTFDAPVLVNVTGTEDLTGKDLTLSAITFDAPTLEYNWNTPDDRTFIVDDETRELVIPAESREFVIDEDPRAVLITASSESKYRNEITYNGLTGADFTLARATFDAPILNPGWWLAGGVISEDDVVAVYQPYGADDYAASKVNLANPGTYDLTNGSNYPTWDIDYGWIFEYSERQYLVSTIVPASGWSMIVKFNFSRPVYPILSYSGMIGVNAETSTKFEMAPAWANTGVRFYAAGGINQISSGFYSNGIMSMLGQQPCYNGATDGAACADWSGEQTYPISIGALNTANTIGYHFQGIISHIAIYRTIITSAQLAAVEAAISDPPINYSYATATAPSGSKVLVLVPANYNAVTGAPLVIYHHGVGESHLDMIDNKLKRDTIDALLAAGYIVASSEGGTPASNWGNDSSITAYQELYTYCSANYNITRVCALSQSMGGISGLLAVADGTVPYKGWLGVYPACNLAWCYANGFTGAIKTAYGIASDGSDYDEKTAGHDPVLLDGADFTGIRMRFYASSDDLMVTKADNADVMAALVADYAAESVVVACTGVHGDPSHFIPAEYVAFFDRCV